MKKAFFLALLPLAACHLHLPHPQVFALDARVSVELPHQPHPLAAQTFKKLKHPERMKIWMLKTFGGTYQLLRTVNPDMRIAAHATLEREAYYNHKIAALKRLKAQGIKSRSFIVAGMKGRDIVYTSHSPAKQALVYSRNLVLDSMSYTLNFFPSYQNGVMDVLEAKQRYLFFHSIKVKP